ncbi:MAG: hypothetical protein RLZZ339_3045 [Cyanobacteriota bacterium]|jgi:hypothetical protein
MEFPVKVNGVEKNPQKNVGKVFQITNFVSSPQFSHLKNRGKNNQEAVITGELRY